MLPAPNRLRERSEFASAIRAPGATRAGSRILVVHANVTDPRAGLPPRVGFVVSKAVGNAVVRNRTKRRLRAAIATQLTGIPDGVDIVVRAQPAAATATFAELSESLIPLLHKAIRRLQVAS
ncbi:ribonuclease P protein component [Knoellia subterranea]|uniref:Ribonuclease P protein component n=1 Tax=Knoellia subterranea KCTC 19937 TaxID=1385521 RepID=A0A0A0JJZ7_9MICO|nr:ribonuclease P protein component [Knoellia subterranea]KGN37433.1 ribonuclease P [Knoellia subterranea KCTC 19937]